MTFFTSAFTSTVISDIMNRFVADKLRPLCHTSASSLPLAQNLPMMAQCFVTRTAVIGEIHRKLIFDQKVAKVVVQCLY